MNGSADQIDRMIVRSYDGGEGSDVDYLHIKLRDNSWFCLGQCNGNLEEAKRIHAAIGLETEPAMERGMPHDGVRKCRTN